MSRTAAVVQPELVEADSTATTAIAPARTRRVAKKAPVSQQDGITALIARLATDPTADVGKLEKLLEMSDRVRLQQAEQAFNTAMSAAQMEMRPIATDADNPQTRSRYASYAQLDRALRPIYTKHGFGLSFNTEPSKTPDFVMVVCLASHAAGFSRKYHIDMPADGKGAKGGDVMTRTHATGSAVTYGMRYLLKMIFNVAVGDDRDDDGNAAGDVETNENRAPAGFADWFDNMSALADEGWPRLSSEWNKARKDYTDYLTRFRAHDWKKMKERAQKVVTRG